MQTRSRIALLGATALVAAVALDLGLRSAARAAPVLDGGIDRTVVRGTDTMESLRACPTGDAGTARSAPSTAALEPRLDGDGSLVGWNIDIAAADERPWRIRLHPESSMSEPVGGHVVVSEDDGVRSVVSIVALDRRCATVIVQTADVVRSAVLRDRDGSVVYHAVDRATRRDLGVWAAVSLDRPPTSILTALAADDDAARHVGRVYLTRLLLDGSGGYLAVQSCGERSCRTRIVDFARGRETRVDDPDQGLLVSFDRERADFVDACDTVGCSHRIVGLALPLPIVDRDFSPIPPGTEITR